VHLLYCVLKKACQKTVPKKLAKRQQKGSKKAAKNAARKAGKKFTPEPVLLMFRNKLFPTFLADVLKPV